MSTDIYKRHSRAICSTRCCSRRTTQEPPPALSVGWDRVDAGLRRRCATSPLHKILSTLCLFMCFLTSPAHVGRHIHTGCILGTLLKQGPTDHLHQAQGQSELKTEVYFGPVVTGARYVLVAQFLAVNFLGEQMKKELVAVKRRVFHWTTCQTSKPKPDTCLNSQLSAEFN